MPPAHSCQQTVTSSNALRRIDIISSSTILFVEQLNQSLKKMNLITDDDAKKPKFCRYFLGHGLVKVSKGLHTEVMMENHTSLCMQKAYSQYAERQRLLQILLTIFVDITYRTTSKWDRYGDYKVCQGWKEHSYGSSNLISWRNSKIPVKRHCRTVQKKKEPDKREEQKWHEKRIKTKSFFAQKFSIYLNQKFLCISISRTSEVLALFVYFCFSF